MLRWVWRGEFHPERDSSQAGRYGSRRTDAPIKRAARSRYSAWRERAERGCAASASIRSVRSWAFIRACAPNRARRDRGRSGRRTAGSPAGRRVDAREELVEAIGGGAGDIVQDEQGPVARRDVAPARSRPRRRTASRPGRRSRARRCTRPRRARRRRRGESRPGSIAPPAPDGRKSRRVPSGPSSAWVAVISAAASEDSPSGRGWVSVWLPIQWPSACARSTSARCARSASPTTKNVAFRPCAASTSRTRGVASGSGPLSKVRVRRRMRVPSPARRWTTTAAPRTSSAWSAAAG